MNVEEQKSTKQYWLYTLLSLVAIVLCFAFAPAWFWVPLPFFLTYLVMAFRAI